MLYYSYVLLAVRFVAMPFSLPLGSLPSMCLALAYVVYFYLPYVCYQFTTGVYIHCASIRLVLCFVMCTNCGYVALTTCILLYLCRFIYVVLFDVYLIFI